MFLGQLWFLGLEPKCVVELPMATRPRKVVPDQAQNQAGGLGRVVFLPPTAASLRVMNLLEEIQRNLGADAREKLAVATRGAAPATPGRRARRANRAS